MRYVNEKGIKEIHDFLDRLHRRGGDHFNEDMLKAWAEDAESQMDFGNPPSIEIYSWDAVSGHTETYTISEEGISEVEMS